MRTVPRGSSSGATASGSARSAGVVVLHSGAVTLAAAGPRGAVVRGPARGSVARVGRIPCTGSSVGRALHLVVSVPAGHKVAAQPGLVVHRRRTGCRSPAVRLRSGRRGRDGARRRRRARVRATTSSGCVCDAVRQGVMPGRVLMARAPTRPRVRHRALLARACSVDAGRRHRVAAGAPVRAGRRAAARPAGGTGRSAARAASDGRWIRADRVYVGLARAGRARRAAGPPVRRGRTTTPGGTTPSWSRAATSTLRYRWRHVVAAPCATAAQVVGGAAVAQAGRATPRPVRPPACAGPAVSAASSRLRPYLAGQGRTRRAERGRRAGADGPGARMTRCR